MPLNSRRPGQLLRRNRRHVLEKRQVPGIDDGERDCDAVLRALHDRVEALCSVAVRACLQGHRDQDSVQQRRCAAVASPARPQRIQAPAASLFCPTQHTQEVDLMQPLPWPPPCPSPCPSMRLSCFTARGSPMHAWYHAGCPIGATCKPLTLDSDPCENKPALPCGADCGICTYG